MYLQLGNAVLVFPQITANRTQNYGIQHRKADQEPVCMYQ